MMEWIGAHWLTILVIVYIIGMTLYGHYRGFFKIAVSSLALIITLVCVNAVLPYITSWMKTHTDVENAIRTSMLDGIGIEQMDSNLIMSPAGQIDAIGNLELPDQIKNLLISNNTGDVWQKLGVEHFADYIAQYLSSIVFNIIGFVVLFVLIFISLHLIMKLLNLFAKLPVIHGLNQIFGAVIGFVLGMVYIWLACMVIAGISGTGIGLQLISLIQQSWILTFIFNHNPVTFFLKSVVFALL